MLSLKIKSMYKILGLKCVFYTFKKLYGATLKSFFMFSIALSYVFICMVIFIQKYNY
jgi:hypothetical protein